MALVNKLEKNYGWVIAATGFVLMLTTMGLSRYVYSMVLPDMKEGLNLTYGHMGMFGSGNLFGYTIFSLAGGILATRYGCKIVMVLSATLVGLAMVFLGMVSSFVWVLLLQILAGMGTAGTFIPLAAILRRWFPPRHQGFFLAVVSAGVGFGNFAAAYSVPLVLGSYPSDGWRYAWVYFGLVTLATAVWGQIGLKNSPSDLVAKSKPGGSGFKEKAMGAVTPINWGSVYKNRAILGLAWVYFLNGFYVIYLVFFVAYLNRGLGLSPAQSASIWYFVGILSIFSHLFWGTLSDKTGRKPAMFPCLSMLALSIALPFFRHDLAGLYLSTIIFGISMAGPMMVVLATVGDAVDTPMVAAAVGLVAMAFGVGQTIAPAVAGVMIDATGSFYPGFLLSAGVLVAELVSFALLRLPRNRYA